MRACSVLIRGSLVDASDVLEGDVLARGLLDDEAAVAYVVGTEAESVLEG